WTFTPGETGVDAGMPSARARMIAAVSPLPPITDGVLVDGWSQATSAPAGTPPIEILGTASNGYGLKITGSGITVRGLAVGGFTNGAGMIIAGANAAHNWIYGNRLGTDPTGEKIEPNRYGVRLLDGARDNVIGTNGDGVNDVAERNLISGNS